VDRRESYILLHFNCQKFRSYAAIPHLRRDQRRRRAILSRPCKRAWPEGYHRQHSFTRHVVVTHTTTPCCSHVTGTRSRRHPIVSRGEARTRHRSLCEHTPVKAYRDRRRCRARRGFLGEPRSRVGERTKHFGQWGKHLGLMRKPFEVGGLMSF